MRGKWKKALCGILTGLMLATAVPAAVPELISATEGGSNCSSAGHVFY